MLAIRRMLLALFLGLLSIPAARAEYVWIEAESAANKPAGCKVGGWGHPEYLSGGSWLFAGIDGKDAADLPPAGVTLDFPFESKSAGVHEVWARVGYEAVRSPMKWRIDDDSWSEDKPGDLTTDLMSLQDWNEVAWVQLGTASMPPGKHVLHIQFERRVLAGRKQPERVLFGLDCFCISKEPFRPNGKYKPDDNFQDAKDKEAAKHVFRVEPAKGPRTTLPLRGLWEISRYDEGEIVDRTEPVTKLPKLGEQFWKAAQVPANRDATRPEMTYAHRFLYRTKVFVPADRAGSAFVLRFPSTALIASVFVNGKYCAGNSTPCAAWDADVTSAIEPGKDNEIVVAIKDLYYAIEKSGDGMSVRTMFNYPASWFYSGSNGGGAIRNADFPVLLQVHGAGILETPSLIVTGPAYVADVFAKPSLLRKELGLEVTVHNASKTPLTVEVANEVVPLKGGLAEKKFAATNLTIPAGEDLSLLNLTESWANPKLWWPDDPQMYEIVTKLSVAGKVVDERRTKFGFREWQWKGQHFTLNGVPWHFHADTTHGGVIPPGEKDAVAAFWKKTGINTVRYWGQRPWVGDSQEETLDWFDTIGMPIRRSGIFDGEGANYNLVETKNGKNVARKTLFDNWIRQTRAQVKAERNHPSVFVWSIENEITFINIRNLGLHDPCEPEIRRAVFDNLAFDPTRPTMIDGGDALRDKSLPIYGNHYNETNFRHYPDEARTMALAFTRDKPNSWVPWPIGDDKPLFLGESFFANGHPPAAYAALIGEQAFLGRGQAEPGVYKFARMLAEGYRWHGIAGFHFWFNSTTDKAEHYQAFQPVCVFTKEWDATFGSGQTMTRHMRVFNDTRSKEPIRLECTFRAAGKERKFTSDPLEIEPGNARDLDSSFLMPQVTTRTGGELTLRLLRGSEEVFRDVKKCFVLARMPLPPRTSLGRIAVYDPKGKATPWLNKHSYSFSEITRLDELPPQAEVLIVGPDALTPREATDPRWVAMASKGMRILVLDQTHPLHFQAVPADLTPTDYVGRIAFPENAEHPAFRGLGKEDFFCWSGDHIVYRNAYKKASYGARSLLQCDDELSCTALVECPVRDGVLVLSQAAIGEKLGTDPVAQRLFANLIEHCLNYKLPAKTTLTVFADGDQRLKLIDSTGLKHAKKSEPLDALNDPKTDIAVVDASPANLAKIAGSPETLKKFTARGGYLMLWGVTPEGLASYDSIVGIEHAIRPFGMERVTLPPVRDSLLAGLTSRDVAQESTEQINPWAADRYPAKDTFTYVVDLDDIAPFAKSAKYGHGWGQMTNGLTSADNWKFIFYHELKSDPTPKWSAEFPKAEEVTHFAIVLNTHYQVVKKLRLLFDDDPKTAVTLDLKGEAELRQEFDVPPIRCKKITMEPIEFDTRGKQPTTGVDNIWITVNKGDDYRSRIVPLANMGVLVKYRMGAGGVVLNQLRVPASETNPVNGPKKQNITATLLRNLEATFAAEKLIVAGTDMEYAPIPLGDKCNAFLDSARGWFDAKLDLSHLPIGEQKLAGVEYSIRDFKTSPLPPCIMLDGPGVRTKLPREVDGIPVGKKADALFFLQTFRRTKEWRPQGNQKDPPALFKYVVHYADGKSAQVPVLYGRGADDWTAETPHGLADAAVAWAAPFPRDATKQAVAYQMMWTNPHPAVEIRSVDAVGGTGYGVPVVLAITAATSRK